MKHKTFLATALIALTACQQLQANPITRGEARRVAQELVGIDSDAAAIASADSDEGKILPYYIFTRGCGKGFVIVSGDDSTAPILGYTDAGDYDETQLPEQLRGMLSHWGTVISQVQQRRQSPRFKAPRARAIASYKKGWENVAPLIKTAWHQDYPYNMLAPVKNGARCASGCVATAGSQVTYYFHKDNPTELQYDTPTYSYGTPVTESLPKGTPIEWNLMRLNGTGTQKQDSAVAKLMYALGTSAWLTYGDGEGTATSGHNEKMADAMKGQFNLNCQHKYKGGETQEEWERLIYNNLKSRRPMLYSGYKDEQTGGHSVVLDGYQASTGLYHFNFGWGGQGNGYYTVDDQTGMNGFNQYQDLVYNITPQVQSLKGAIKSAQLYHKAPSTVIVEVENTGTLDYAGYYLYANAQSKLSSRVTATDTKTETVTGVPQELTFSMTPTSQQPLYIFLCDKQKTILDSCLVDVTPTIADLTVEHFTVDAGTEVTTVDDMHFAIVNNAEAHVTVTLTNGPQGTYCQPAFQCFLEQYDTQTHSWGGRKGIVINDIVFENLQTQDAVFTFEGLTEGTLYRAFLNEQVQATEPSALQFAGGVARELYFTVRSSDLSVTIDGRQATVTGRWNSDLFSQQASDARVCAYDISGLSDLNSQPVAANPNALFYTDQGTEVMKQFHNIVVGDACAELLLQADADFMPMRAFTAHKATLVMPDAAAGNWQSVVTPFAVEAPLGMQLKAPAEWISQSTVIVAYRHVLQAPALTPLIYITGHDALNCLTATDVTIGTDTYTTLFDGQLGITTMATAAEPTWLFVGDNYGTPYYKADGRAEVAPFQSFVMSTTGKQMRTTETTALDGNYRSLSVAINKVYAQIAERGEQPADVSSLLLTTLQQAETMLTYRQLEVESEVLGLRDDLLAALTDYLENGGQGIDQPVDGDSMSSAPVYYGLSGQRLEQPSRGVTIVRLGRDVRKVVHF